MYEMCQGKAQHTLLHIMLRYDKNETRSLRDWTMHKWFKHEILMPVKYKIAIQCPRASKEIQQFCKDIFVHINLYTSLRILCLQFKFLIFYPVILSRGSVQITYQATKVGGNLVKTLSQLSSFQKWNTIQNMSVVSCHFKILNTYKHGLWIYDAVVLKRRGYQPFWNVSSYHVLDCQKIYPK